MTARRALGAKVAKILGESGAPSVQHPKYGLCVLVEHPGAEGYLRAEVERLLWPEARFEMRRTAATERVTSSFCSKAAACSSALSGRPQVKPTPTPSCG